MNPNLITSFDKIRWMLNRSVPWVCVHVCEKQVDVDEKYSILIRIASSQVIFGRLIHFEHCSVFYIQLNVKFFLALKLNFS